MLRSVISNQEDTIPYDDEGEDDGGDDNEYNGGKGDDYDDDAFLLKCTHTHTHTHTLYIYIYIKIVENLVNVFIVVKKMCI
jgi:hypothetical protein